MEISRRAILVAAGSSLIFRGSAMAQSSDSEFSYALHLARFRFDRLSQDRLFRARVVGLVSVYIDASVGRQVHSLGIGADAAEIRAGNEILQILSDGRDVLSDLESRVRALSVSQIIDISISFKSLGYDRVMRDELGVSGDSKFSLDMIEALAFYAIVSAALVDSGRINTDIFRPGEFCILPFWPFC